jgi:hypothetical protein
MGEALVSISDTLIVGLTIVQTIGLVHSIHLSALSFWPTLRGFSRPIFGNGTSLRLLSPAPGSGAVALNDSWPARSHPSPRKVGVPFRQTGDKNSITRCWLEPKSEQ